MNLSELVPPQEAERRLRRDLPSWQTHYTSDDYTDMTWFAPTVRFYIGRAVLKAPPGFAYPEWALNALGGIPATIDPTVETAGKTIAGTIIDLMTDNAALARAKAEFRTRRDAGGGPGSVVRLCLRPSIFPGPNMWRRRAAASGGFRRRRWTGRWSGGDWDAAPPAMRFVTIVFWAFAQGRHHCRRACPEYPPCPRR